MSIAHHIREIGRGKDGTRSLGHDEAVDLMSRVLAGTVSDLEVGAFAVAMRIKGESLPELTGFLQATHAHCTLIPADRPVVVLPSYNGARRLPNLTPLLAVLLARAGAPVLVHGTVQAPGRITSHEVFRELGLPIASAVDDVHRAWQRREPVFMTTDNLCAPLARLLAVRDVIGLRNSGHTLAKLLLPIAGARALRVVNYTHPEYADLLQRFMAESAADALLMRGTEGEPVADVRRPTPMACYVQGRERPDLLAPDAAGAGTEATLPRGCDAARTVACTQAVLSGELPVPSALGQQVISSMRALAALAAAASMRDAVAP